MNSSGSNDPFQLVKQIAGWIVAITGFVATIAGFIQTVQGNLSLYTTLLLIVGAVISDRPIDVVVVSIASTTCPSRSLPFALLSLMFPNRHYQSLR
jgi:hypothetical protein